MNKYEGMLQYVTEVTGLKRKRTNVYPKKHHNPIIWVKKNE